jgi:hypothetical protein
MREVDQRFGIKESGCNHLVDEKCTSHRKHPFGASQSVMSRLENDILGTSSGREALNAMITRSTDVLLKRKNKKRLILDVDSTEDPAHGNQEQMAYNGHFGKDCRETRTHHRRYAERHF